MFGRFALFGMICAAIVGMAGSGMAQTKQVIFSRVSNVMITPIETVLVLMQAGACGTNEFKVSREGGDWQYRTSRMMQAQRESMTLAVQYLCHDDQSQTITGLAFQPSEPIGRIVESQPQAF